LLKDGDKGFRTIAGPIEVIEVTKVALVPGGGFYPMKGTIKTLNYETEANYDGKAFVMEDFLRGKYSLPKGEVVEETEWEVTKIAAGWKVPQGLFELPFPDGTIIIDRRNEKNNAMKLGIGTVVAGIFTAGLFVSAFFLGAFVAVRRFVFPVSKSD
jgi:hypothetical protein